MPARIGAYEVVGRLAFGGSSGEVWVAKGVTGQLVAIQQMPRNARGSLARHPNLVEVREVVRHDQARYRVMEYLEGENLAGLIRRLIKKRERISLGLAAHMIAEVCDGLNAAHTAGELHRAVSPEAVFITYGGEVKVLELGTAIEDPGSLYLSPEQRANQPLGRQSDVYAIGLVLYELTTLRRVFGEARELGQEIPPPSTQTDIYPPQLDAICMQALARDPTRRFRSALELRDALLTTARALDSSGDPAQALASKLMRLFGDRIATKRAVLDRVKLGVPIGDVAAAEADEDIEIPVISRETLDEDPVAAIPSPPPAPQLEPANPPAPPRLSPQNDTGEVISLGPGVLARAAAPALRASGVRWGVLVWLLVAIVGGGVAGAWLRRYGLPF
jgi:serine/threonine protein kinase